MSKHYTYISKSKIDQELKKLKEEKKRPPQKKKKVAKVIWAGKKKRLNER